MVFRTHCPKIWHLGILNISSRKNLRNGICRRRAFGPSPGAGHKTLRWEVVLLYLEERNILISGDKGTEKNLNEKAFLSFPSLLPLAHSLGPTISFHDFPLFVKPSIHPDKFTLDSVRLNNDNWTLLVERGLYQVLFSWWYIEH